MTQQLPTSQSLIQTKRTIWSLCNQDPITLQLAADRAKVRLPITQQHQADTLLESIQKRIRAAERKRSIPKTITRESITRYLIAHVEWFKRTLPVNYRDGHYAAPKLPDTRTANGLTNFVINHATWCGYHANRISSSGRMINGKYIPGQTKKGTADVAIIGPGGKSIHIEIKVGSDKPSPAQFKEQNRIRSVGGVYEFVHTPEEYFAIIDRVVT